MSRPSEIHAVPALPSFEPNDWARRYKANGERSEANSYMDSGWSKATADDCQSLHVTLLLELLKELQEVELKPEDFFDRPRLAAVLAAVHEINKRVHEREPEPEDCPACLGDHACDLHGAGPIMPNDRMRIDQAGNVTDAHGRGNL